MAMPTSELVLLFFTTTPTTPDTPPSPMRYSCALPPTLGMLAELRSDDLAATLPFLS